MWWSAIRYESTDSRQLYVLMFYHIMSFRWNQRSRLSEILCLTTSSKSYWIHLEWKFWKKSFPFPTTPSQRHEVSSLFQSTLPSTLNAQKWILYEFLYKTLTFCAISHGRIFPSQCGMHKDVFVVCCDDLKIFSNAHRTNVLYHTQQLDFCVASRLCHVTKKHVT